MLWYKGWFETRFRLLFMLVMTGPFLFTIHRLGAPGTVRSVSVGIVAFASYSVPALTHGGLRVSGGRGNRHAAFAAGNERAAWVDAVHAVAAGEPDAIAGRPRGDWMAGDGGDGVGVLCCEMWFADSGTAEHRDAGGDVRAGGNDLHLQRDCVLSLGAAGDVSRRSVARVGDVAVGGCARVGVLCIKTSPPAFADLFHAAWARGRPLLRTRCRGVRWRFPWGCR